MSDTESVALTSPADDEIGLERLQRRPIIDRIDARQLDLIKRTIAVAEGDQAITNAELGHFLELTAHYGLDPFAREAWIAKSKTGKLLIMVGREGLRKIVNRNGMKMSSAVVHAKDVFRVTYIDNPEDAKPGEWEAWGRAPFHRITHEHVGLGEMRGPIAGAWARVRHLTTGQEHGYFDAPLSEYMPSNASTYSPWSKQTSAMTRGAVERQAAAEATSLGGLMAIGEDESANAAQTIGSGVGDGSEPGWHGLSIEMVASIERTLEAAAARGWSLDRGTVQMRLSHQSVGVVEAWIADTYDQIAKLPEPEEIPEAEVVEHEGAEAASSDQSESEPAAQQELGS